MLGIEEFSKIALSAVHRFQGRISFTCLHLLSPIGVLKEPIDYHRVLLADLFSGLQLRNDSAKTLLRFLSLPPDVLSFLLSGFSELNYFF